MRKIECACGISLDIYTWPSAEVEQNGKKMIERHIRCHCEREIVVRTAPKYELDAEVAEDEKISAVSSFAELSRQFGVLKEAEPHNKPLTGDVDESESPKKTVTFSDEEANLLNALLLNYGNWFKQGKASAADKAKFLDLADRIGKAAWGDVPVSYPLEVSEEDGRMFKMALSERNLFHIYGDTNLPADVAREVEVLKTHIKEIFG